MPFFCFVNGHLGFLIRVNAVQAWRRLLGIQKQSRLLTTIIIAFIVGYFIFAYWLFYYGLKFIGGFPGIGGILVERLLFLLFAFLFFLLLLSNLVISYTNFFRNRETQYLLTLPVETNTIFRWKFAESLLLASWAFLFLISPLLLAYGIRQQVDWHFYPVTALLIALFILLPGVAGSWLAAVVAKFLDRKGFQVVALIGLVIIIGGMVYLLKTQGLTDDLEETRALAVMDRLLAKTRFANYPLLPSYWLSTSVVQWAESALSSAAFFAAVLLSNVLFFGALAFTKMGHMIENAFSVVQSRESILGRWNWYRKWKQRKSYELNVGALEKFFRILPFVPEDMRAILVKDARVFWRDTTQLGQTIVLFGLLAAYIINLRHFSQQLTNPFWIHLISFLNMGACSLNLATLTTRFVFPQFSLEGKRLWIIGMAPMGLKRVVWAKFWLAGFFSLGITVSLLLVSCHMLNMAWDRTTMFAVAVAIMSFTLTALALGLGVLYPNFKEDNPGKIVSGFGGTFCLVMSFLYIAGAVALLAFGSPWSWGGQGRIDGQVLFCWGLFLILSFMVGGGPLRGALKRLEAFEL